MTHYYRLPGGDMVETEQSELDRGGHPLDLITIWPAWPHGGGPGTAHRKNLQGPYRVETTANGCDWLGDPNYRAHDTVSEALRRMAEWNGQGRMRFAAVEPDGPATVTV